MQSLQCLIDKRNGEIIRTMELNIYCQWSINVSKKDSNRISMINHQFNKKCEIQRASLAGYTKIFINCNLKAEKSLERLGSELNYKNIIDQKDVKLSTSTILLHQSQNPDWSEVGN